ncbi:hypothetical protein NDU88_004343 [Pleurodeles waltl]|uniref:Uncharacterized protein n=1 Tax=Pleurodeles waltl TaxID=8319 RepID=A0AAV7VK00_PLEWA|nr:hypothetical protein NDU88_004343 [Pleurodeles waltl]
MHTTADLLGEDVAVLNLPKRRRPVCVKKTVRGFYFLMFTMRYLLRCFQPNPLEDTSVGAESEHCAVGGFWEMQVAPVEYRQEKYENAKLDLFAMKPTETSVPVVTPTTSTASPALATTPSPPFPAAATTATTTTTTTATTSASTTTSTTTAPALDIFGDLFDSVSEVPTAPKSDTAPHIDLLDSDDFSSASHGVSPLAESSLTADLLSVDAFAAPPPVPTASPAKVDSSAVIDLFGEYSADAFGGCTTEPQSTAQAVSSSSASADLLAGFGGSFMAPSAAPITPAQNNVLQTNFYAAFGATPATGGSSFDPSGFDGLGDLLMPMVPAAQSSGSPISMSMNASGSSKVLGGDLDSSLAKLVGTFSKFTCISESQETTNKGPIS